MEINYWDIGQQSIKKSEKKKHLLRTTVNQAMHWMLEVHKYDIIISPSSS